MISFDTQFQQQHMVNTPAVRGRAILAAHCLVGRENAWKLQVQMYGKNYHTQTRKNQVNRECVWQAAFGEPWYKTVLSSHFKTAHNRRGIVIHPHLKFGGGEGYNLYCFDYR